MKDYVPIDFFCPEKKKSPKKEGKLGKREMVSCLHGG